MVENLNLNKNEVISEGFTVVDEVYTKDEIDQIIYAISNAEKGKETFRKSKDLFAIRQFLKEIPAIKNLIFNQNLNTLIQQIFGDNYFVVKSLYFDKPPHSNWYVAYHQDLTISVSEKISQPGFGPWTVKQNQFGVQPPLEILENIFTLRIHLDDTDENNGALKVIPKSHLKKIVRPETLNLSSRQEKICKVNAGGVMIMKPLLLHSSSRTTNQKQRRVIHIEFSNSELPDLLEWAERG